MSENALIWHALHDVVICSRALSNFAGMCLPNQVKFAQNVSGVHLWTLTCVCAVLCICGGEAEGALPEHPVFQGKEPPSQHTLQSLALCKP